jgi:hypothetical protein
MSPRRRTVLLAFLATSLGLGAIVLSFPNLYDADSYFHLAVARDYARGALRGGLRWARLSALADGFGDKELLFHLLLAPFASMKDGARAGWAAVALLNGVVAAVVAAAAWPVLFYLVDRGAGDVPQLNLSAATELWHDALDSLEET